MSGLKEQFEEAVELVRTAEGDFRPPNELKLEMYALYKQATEGDVRGKRPGMLDFVGRAKYDAWAACRGMSVEEAMRRYVAKVNELKAKLGS